MNSRKIKKWIIFSGLLWIVSEFTLRTFFIISLGVPFFRTDLLVLNYYPELRPYLYPDLRVEKKLPRVLILGGSAAHTSFCDLDMQINQDSLGNYVKKFNVDTLAQYAQNSLDSWYKYRLLEKLKFKYVIFYHGINDARTNNCPSEIFDKNYRHISFYNELFILFRHPEVKFILVPWFADYIFQKILEATDIRKTIPKEYNVMSYYLHKTATEDPWWKFGEDVKSKSTFKKNLGNILNLANQKGDSVLVISYAWFQPPDYSLKKFIDKQLGYTEHRWPTELYGLPSNVEAGIVAHNNVGRELATVFPIAIPVEFANSLPKDGKYFFDICHVTPVGCSEMGKKIRPLIFQ